MFFWIIVLSFLVPMAVRLYRRSVRGRNQGMPGQFGRFPGNQNNPGPATRATSHGTVTRSRTTLAASASWALRSSPGSPGRPTSAGEPYPGGQYPGQQYPGQPFPNEPYPGPRFPNQPFPTEPYPGQQYPGPVGYGSPVPYEDSPEYLNNPPQPQRHDPAQGAGQPPAPPAPQAPQSPSAPQGYRARKLAELDQKYSDGKLSMEDYMAQRAEIMKG